MRKQKSLGTLPNCAFAILGPMRFVRRAAVTRIMAVVLLMWTAADISNAGLCALDNEDGDGVAVGCASVAGGDKAPTSPTFPPPHVDDCFCCSHCVDVGWVSGATVPVIADSRIPLPPEAVPFPSGFPLYHPPRA